jgi:hypothetical protein
MTPTDKIPVTLEAQSWEQIMRVLADAPFRVVAPLIAEIQNQCARQRQTTPEATD